MKDKNLFEIGLGGAIASLEMKSQMQGKKRTEKTEASQRLQRMIESGNVIVSPPRDVETFQKYQGFSFYRYSAMYTICRIINQENLQNRTKAMRVIKTIQPDTAHIIRCYNNTRLKEKEKVSKLVKLIMSYLVPARKH